MRFRSLALVAALLVFTGITAIALPRSSLVLDGARYFWLDDDQMVSMRYARNLVEGAGFVWNPGERVEGYTSVGWTLAMAAVHLLPLSDAMFPLAMKIVAWLLGCCVIVLTDRALRQFVPQPGLSRPAILITLVLCFDLVFWSTNGFETTLLTALFLLAFVRIIDDSERGLARPSTFLLVGALPLARSDAFHLWAALLVLSFSLRGGGSRVLASKAMWARRAAFAAPLPLAHTAFRRWYYGDWLPNTYYLKVADYSGRFTSGLGYLKNFATTYIVVLVLVLAYAWWSRDRRGRWIVVASAVSIAHVLVVGRDIFPHFRYVAPWVPIFLVLAAAACVEFTAAAPIARRVLVGILAVTTIIDAGIRGFGTLAMLRDQNGGPETGLIAAVMIRQHARPEATVAVTSAGVAPYFSRRRAVDILGKTDAHIAHLHPRAGGDIGHGKFDIDYSLSRGPDLIVTPWSLDFNIEQLEPRYAVTPFIENDYRVALLRTRRFVEEYKDRAIRIQYLWDDGDVSNAAIYARQGTPEAESLTNWTPPIIGR
jgi:hypothetical protein